MGSHDDDDDDDSSSSSSSSLSSSSSSSSSSSDDADETVTIQVDNTNEDNFEAQQIRVTIALPKRGSRILSKGSEGNIVLNNADPDTITWIIARLRPTDEPEKLVLHVERDSSTPVVKATITDAFTCTVDESPCLEGFDPRGSTLRATFAKQN